MIMISYAYMQFGAVIEMFIQARRYESPTLFQLLQGFSIIDCTWLAPSSTQSIKQRSTAEDMRKRKEIVHEWLYWLIDGFVMELVKVCSFVVSKSVNSQTADRTPFM